MTGSATRTELSATVERVGIFDRIGDRLNPILIREVNQALRGRAFLVTGILALFTIVIIALVVAAQGEEATGSGGEVLAGTLMALVPLLMFIVPLQAFISTRQEVTLGTSEHLHLSRLTPGAIIRGKIAASMVQLLLYLSVFAPLLAMTFLLRGVDVPTIAISIVLCTVSGLGACSLAVACGALCRGPSFIRVLPVIAVVVGLGGITLFLVGQLGSIPLGWLLGGDSPEFWQMVLGFGIPTLVGIVLCGMVGAAALAHPYENRSTAFRVFAFAALILGGAWTFYMTWVVNGSLAAHAPEMAAMYVITCSVLLAIFPIFAATEETALSPRVRSRVFRRPIPALLSAPFLPGGGRGVLFGTLLAGVALTGLLVTACLMGSSGLDERWTGVACNCWLYVLIYAGIVAFIRRFLPGGQRGNWIARIDGIVLFMLSILLPLLVGVISGRRFGSGWEIYDIMNPFSTLDHFDGTPRSPFLILPFLALIWGGTLVLNTRAMVRSVKEVLEASRERRLRAR